MKKDPKRLLIISILSVFIPTFLCCYHHGTAWGKMDKAEEIMNARPDSALTILNTIQSQSLSHVEEKARYSLLMSMALDKNYIDTTTFDILQPAIDYYTKNGTPDEQLRTYYYQGRIYQNRGEDDSAMNSFMNCHELKGNVRDTLLLAHTLVAQGTLYLKQYKINDFVSNNLEAAVLYGAIGKDILEIKSYSNVLNGFVIMNNKSASDSILSICMPLVHKNPDGEEYIFTSLLSYTVELCTTDEIKAFLNEYHDLDLSKDETINFAYGYYKIGEYNKALRILEGINPTENIMESLKYSSVKIEILEKQGKYEQALSLYKDYSAVLERYQNHLLSQDLLFAEKKHNLEMENFKIIQNRNRIIMKTLCGIFALILIIGWLYYRNYRSKTRRTIAEKENKHLKLEQDNLRKEKEKAMLERDNKILEAKNLEKDKKRLEAEKREHELESANLKLEIAQLEGERDNLKELREQLELTKPIDHVIKNRLEMLNGLLAKEITQNENYAVPYNEWIESIHNDKKRFMDSTRLAFAASHPKFMDYLKQHGLSIDEINYLCLYAIGLRGKEVGEYIQKKRHYIISHEIRKKLSMDEHETNIGPYIRKLIKKFEQ